MNNKHFQINWTKGMRLNEKVFSESDDHITYQLTQIRGLLSKQSYGLFPQTSSYQFNIQGDIKNNKFSIQHLVCKALTPSGYFIDIDTNYPVQSDLLSCDIPSHGDEFDLYIYADPFAYIPVGKEDPTDPLGRKPYIDTKYELRLVVPGNESELNQENACLLARFHKHRNHFKQSDSFIPPCITIKAHNQLNNISIEIQKLIASLYGTLLQKRQTSNRAGLINALQMGIMPVCVEINNDFGDKTPHDLFILIKKTITAYVFAGQIENQSEADPLFYHYINKTYNHNDIYASVHEGVEAIQNMLSIIGGLEDIEREEPIIEEPIIEPTPRRRRDIQI